MEKEYFIQTINLTFLQKKNEIIKIYALAKSYGNENCIIVDKLSACFYYPAGGPTFKKLDKWLALRAVFFRKTKGTPDLVFKIPVIKRTAFGRRQTRRRQKTAVLLDLHIFFVYFKDNIY